MTRSRLVALDTALWSTQISLSLVVAGSGFLKAWVPAADLQERLGLMAAAQPGLLRPVGFVELLLALALVVPAAARVLPRLTPFAAACLGATAVLGQLQPASAGGLGLFLADLALVVGAAFVAWGRLAAAPIEPAAFGPEPEVVDPAAAARLERNRQRRAARSAGARGVA